MLKNEISINNIRRAVSNPFLAFDQVVLQHLYRVPSTYLNGRYMVGTNVFDREWDVLIILDTCRVDALRAVSPEYDFLDNIGEIKSVGGATPEWIARTFDMDRLHQIQNTAYLSGTAQLRGVLDEKLPASRSIAESHIAYKLLSSFNSVDIDDLAHVEYLFKHEPPGEEGPLGHKEGLTPPRYVTDRGISVNREQDHDRVILHYMQPHSPYVANAIAEERDLLDHEPRPLAYLRETGGHELVWETYLDELRYVLDEVELLLDNIDAERVAITADHGEAFGEYGIYGHQIGSLHPKIRNVPWATTTASDTNTYTPSIEELDEAAETEQTTEEMLEALGYKF
jgi:hypothetical protein